MLAVAKPSADFFPGLSRASRDAKRPQRVVDIPSTIGDELDGVFTPDTFREQRIHEGKGVPSSICTVAMRFGSETSTP
ncbi:MAG: hypothetical protein ABI704_16085 [Kofleriaceae bacterium]